MANETIEKIFNSLDSSIDEVLRDYDKVKNELHKQEREVTTMVKKYGSSEIDQQVWVCEKCGITCLTSYRSKPPYYCPCCGRKVKNAEV